FGQLKVAETKKQELKLKGDKVSCCYVFTNNTGVGKKVTFEKKKNLKLFLSASLTAFIADIQCISLAS
ncbi:MAG: hypothetical protein ACRC3B_22605, partial [Bacteroidia bacterium]